MNSTIEQNTALELSLQERTKLTEQYQEKQLFA